MSLTFTITPDNYVTAISDFAIQVTPSNPVAGQAVVITVPVTDDKGYLLTSETVHIDYGDSGYTYAKTCLLYTSDAADE